MACDVTSQAPAREAGRERNLERLAKLRPIDDEFMRVMFQGQLGLAQEVLRTITGVGDLVLVREEVQHDVRRLAGSRSVVLDVYGEDSEGRRYDLEVQRSGRGAEPRRARYHGSAMDVEALGSGEDFDALPERYVVFVTEGDFFGKGAALYRFEPHDAALGLPLGDGSHVIYANGAYRGDDEMGALMHDFSCSDPDDMSIGPLADRVRYLKESPEGVSRMSRIMEEIREEGRLEGLEKGLKKGMEKGLEKGRVETFCGLVRDGVLTQASAAERLGMTPEQFAARAAEYGFALA